MNTSPLPNVNRLLELLRRGQRTLGTLTWVQSGMAVIILALYIAISAEAIFWFDPIVRLPLLQSLIVLAGIVFLIMIAGAFWSYRSKSLHDANLARLIWERSPKLRDTILDALQLASKKSTDGSEALRLEALRRFDISAEDVLPDLFLKRTLFKRSLFTVITVVGLLLITILIAGSEMSSAVSRMRVPSTAFIKPGTVLLSLETPDTITVIQGGDLTVNVRSHHSTPSSVTVTFIEGSGLVSRQNALRDESDSTLFIATFPMIERNGYLFAESRKAVSDSSSVRLLYRPRMARLNVSLKPPSYTGQPRFSLPDGSGDIRALPGSLARISLESSRPLSEATINRTSANGKIKSSPMDIKRKVASSSFAINQPGEWWIELVSDENIAGDEPIKWTINLDEDRAPRVTIRLPEAGTVLPEQMALPLAALAEDDYGISQIELRYRIYNEFMDVDSVGEEAFMKQPLQFREITPGRYVVEVIWGLADLPLFPPEEVHYFIRVWDNNLMNGPLTTRTELRRLVFPSMEELFEDTDAREQDIVSELEGSRERAEMIREQLQSSLEAFKSNPDEMSWQEAQTMEQALKAQESMLNQLEKASSMMEELQQQFSEHGLVENELLNKYDQLQQLVEEIATPEMRAAMEKLREAIENRDGDEVRDALEQMMLDQEKFIEKMDRSIAILEQLKAERLMEELAQRAEDLAKREDEISREAAENLDNESSRLSQQQKMLAEELQNLQEDIEAAESVISPKNSEVADSLAAISQQIESSKLAMQMQETSQNLAKSAPGSPEESAEQAKQLQELADQLSSLQKQFSQQSKDDLAEKIDQISEKLLIISRRQEDLISESLTLGIASPRYRPLAARQSSLIEGLDQANLHVEELARETFFVGAPLLGEMMVARSKMDGAILRYTDRLAKDASGKQTEALASVHRGLEILNQAQENLEQSGSSTGYQEMMDQLQKMAEQQQSLNQSSEGMPMPMPGQGSPSDQGMPMQGQGQQSGQGMSQLAAQQRALSEAMRKLEQGAGSMKEMMGSLEGLGDAMEAVSKDLENKNVTERTKILQKRIVQRLLDSQKSLEEHETSRSRKSRSGKDIARKSPGAHEAPYDDILRQRMLDALKDDFSEPWQEVIRDYYRALELNSNR